MLSLNSQQNTAPRTKPTLHASATMSILALLALGVPSNAPALQTTSFFTRSGTLALRPQLVQRHE